MNRLTCTNPDIGQLISHFEMGLLDAADRDRFEEHLLECGFCAHEVQSMDSVMAALRANRDAVRRGLAEDGITLDALKKKLLSHPRGQRRRGMWESFERWSDTLRRPAVLWSTAGTLTGLAILLSIIYLVVSPRTPLTGRYVPLLSFQALPYEGSMTLRGEAAVKGQEDFDAGMQAYLRTDYKEAARHLKRAVEKTSDRAEWWLYLGICSYLQHDPKPAIRALGRADELARGSDRIRARWFLAQAHLLQGNRESAEPLLEWIVTQNKDYYKEAFDTLTRLRELGSADISKEANPLVVSPQGGEIFLAGSTITVAWEDAECERVKQYQLWLSSDGGITYPKLMAAGLKPSDSYWMWKEARDVGSQLSVRVVAVREDGTVQNAGSKRFAISVPPRIAVHSPQQGDHWRRGVTHPISWSNAGTWPMSFDLELYQIKLTDTSLVETIANGLPGTASSWMWTDTSSSDDARESGEHFLVKVSGLFTDGEVSAWSDGDFFLAPLSVVTVDSIVNGAQPWFEGDVAEIGWQSSESGVLGYSIQLCASRTMDGEPLVQNLPPESDHWIWKEMGPPGSYLIRVIAHYPEGDVPGFSPSWLDIKPRSGDDQRRLASADEAGATSSEAHSFNLQQNYPNPFNATTTIRFDLNQAGTVRLQVFNSLGQIVSTLVDGPLSVGHHAVPFDGRGLSSGMYLYRLEVGGAVVQKTMVLTK
jgi:tetratricopeptide (TPR) repeat protein